MNDTDNLQYMEVKLSGMETMIYEKYLREMSVFSLKKKNDMLLVFQIIKVGLGV